MVSVHDGDPSCVMRSPAARSQRGHQARVFVGLADARVGEVVRTEIVDPVRDREQAGRAGGECHASHIGRHCELAGKGRVARSDHGVMQPRERLVERSRMAVAVGVSPRRPVSVRYLRR